MTHPGAQTFRIYTAPTAKGRPRFARIAAGVRTFTPKPTREAEDALRWLLRAERAKAYPAGLPLAVSIGFYVARPKSAPKRVVHPVTRPDLDQYVKLVLDAGNGVLWPDDSQIVWLKVRKAYDVEPHIVIHVDVMT